MKKPSIYKPKPLEDWKFVYCTGASPDDLLILMSETGHTGDNYFHAFLNRKKNGKFKSGEEIKAEAKEIYDGLLENIKESPKDWMF